MSLKKLSKKAEIDRVMKRGRSIRDALCGFRAIENDGQGTRIVFLIGTKIDKRAVVRNRLRRQYREIVEELIAAPGPNMDIIFFPTKVAIETPYEKRLESLRTHLQKSRIIPA